MERRHTKHKENILGLFLEHHILSAHAVRVLLPTVDTSTIYRNLRQFVSDGVLREVYAESGVVSYERADTRHDHFVCDSCNTIEEMGSCRNVIKDLVPSGARIADGSVVVHGTCGACTKSQPLEHSTLTNTSIRQHI